MNKDRSIEVENPASAQAVRCRAARLAVAPYLRLIERSLRGFRQNGKPFRYHARRA